MQVERCCITSYFSLMFLVYFVLLKGILIVFYYFDSLFSFKKLTQMRIKISRISYFSFSFKLNNKKKVSLKMLALRGVYKKNVCWRGVVALKKIMNKVMCTSGRPPSLLNQTNEEFSDKIQSLLCNQKVGFFFFLQQFFSL